MKAVVLFSSGLDSLITLHLLRSFGIDVAALNIVTPFHDVSEAAKRRAEMYGFPCYVRQTGEEYVPLVMKPRWGYGTAVNPCIDCRIRMCRMAGELMREIGADFAATGEITGQRPNSQKQHQLLLIDRESGLSGYLLRPLSARVLPPTEVEKRGFIDREKLLGFSGRGRGHLIRLAQSFGVKEIPQPASGCLLCEKTFAPRILDTMKHIPEPTCWDFRILRFGRLLRINESLRCVIARDVKDCRNLARLFEQEDRSASVFLEPENFNGPALLMVGAAAQEHAALAGA
ncbi:MAG: hypothetical protein LBQ54_13550, partial [Planctomycetaceae bacterium]|nr:hypothetical protein [Planctomycetaceae bacterium]